MWTSGEEAGLRRVFERGRGDFRVPVRAVQHWGVGTCSSPSGSVMIEPMDNALNLNRIIAASLTLGRFGGIKTFTGI